ncbi:hypothetical protein L202_08273 [Cryptococcus amylolentus CBS 6039]|uniref:CCZ1/INTU/HSP4 first Longin domain-containing protein n=1 Tax=Cryptococcus amylolentus CBS 6039 TaxID=1295533 RepID=A0A1E3H911_9TREE|nr:hypothetical protein L202_08273 [Cryptococcus amylolentus CBS 6039]ODN72842.1 hypothetical protein L202_08273 [Cryptococcus amylolentus CBS 6039]
MPPPGPSPGSTTPASLSHFAIFNPNLKPSEIHRNHNEEERDRDDEDDQREAAQILFYTAREGGGVSRNTMLRQVGLAKGLMAFGDMVAKEDAKFWSIRSHKQRLIIYTPEPDFYIYICIQLANIGENNDPAPAAQGLSDQLLVSGLTRGYEDFRLLHGTLSSHTPLTPSTSFTVDKFFTRFAFEYEASHVSESPSMRKWLGGFPLVHVSLDDTVNTFKKEWGEEYPVLIIGKDGPLHTNSEINDLPLLRHLTHLVQLSLPPPPPLPVSSKASKTEQTSSLGFGLLSLGAGKKKAPNDLEKGRKASWPSLGWVPDLRRVSSPSLPSFPALYNTSLPQPHAALPPVSEAGKGADVGKDKKNWDFGLGAIGDAVGNVGNVFGLPALPGKGTKPASGTKSEATQEISEAASEGTERDVSATIVPSLPSETSETPEPAPEVPDTIVPQVVKELDEAEREEDPQRQVEAGDVSLPELAEAVQADEEMEWDDRSVWITVHSAKERSEHAEEAGGGLEERRLYWIIRDTILIAIVLPTNLEKPYLKKPYSLPPSVLTLKLVASISSLMRPPPEKGIKSEKGKEKEGAWVYRRGDQMQEEGEIPKDLEKTFANFRGTFARSPDINEIMGKTASSRFVVAKRNQESEMYLACAPADGSLTDAEQSLRAIVRAHPEIEI